MQPPPRPESATFSPAGESHDPVSPDLTNLAAAKAKFIRSRMPEGGLFAGHEWRVSPDPFPLAPEIARELETLGRVLLQFYRAINLLYRRSVEGKQPAWVAAYLDQGKPAELIELQRSPAFRNDVPRIIRPDVLLTETGLSITELDSVPGGIGLTAWLGQTYAEAEAKFGAPAPGETVSRGPTASMPSRILGGAEGMLRGFEGIFGSAAKVHLVISDEAATYRPEMSWMAGQLGSRFEVREAGFTDPAEGDAVYRFFELFDLANVQGAGPLFNLAREKRISLTPPPKPLFEEKMLFALLWNRNLQAYWRQELGESFFQRLLKIIPYTWIVDPAPLPPHAALPEIGLTDWNQLKTLSQRDRNVILKVSGYSEEAWGARGVYLGSDLSQAEWSAAVDKALASFHQSPYVLQRFEKPRSVAASFHDSVSGQLTPMDGRVRLCPYYFVVGEGDAARTQLGGVLATICPADKKIIHGMRDAILAPCST